MSSPGGREGRIRGHVVKRRGGLPVQEIERSLAEGPQGLPCGPFAATQGGRHNLRIPRPELDASGVLVQKPFHPRNLALAESVFNLLAKGSYLGAKGVVGLTEIGLVRADQGDTCAIEGPPAEPTLTGRCGS